MARKNLLKIPKEILERIAQFGQDDVVVACAKHIAHDQIKAYAGLGLKVENGEIVTPAPFIPNPKAGRYSHANVEGKEVIRKDLPKYTKSFPVEAPDWNGYGTHTIWFDREVYPRDFYPPKEVELAITVLERRDSGALIKFAVNEVINRRTPNFKDALFYNLNILQENVGAVDVFESEATLAEYAASVRVDWEILPPGTSIDQIVANIKARGNINAHQESTMRQRLAVIRRLEPGGGYVVGTTGFARYFGAKFGNDFVVFENIRYGNALYIMRENWKELSQRTRMELLAGDYDEVTRIEHRQGWDDTLSSIVQKYKDERRRGLL
jgi:hypothetical protein